MVVGVKELYGCQCKRDQVVVVVKGIYGCQGKKDKVALRAKESKLLL